MSWRTWRAGAPDRRLRRLARKEAFVYCPGTTATHWANGGMDFDVCSMEGCEQPNGGRCLAALQTEVRYKIRCAVYGVEP